jgi:uncharacterized protein YjbJ (UPF0337 family)
LLLSRLVRGIQTTTRRRTPNMGAEDKISNKAEELKGKTKKNVGDVTDDREMEAEGRAEESKSSLKQAGEKVKDVFKK